MITVAKSQVNFGEQVRVFATVMPQSRVMYRGKALEEQRSVGGGRTDRDMTIHVIFVWERIRTATRDSRYGFIFAANDS